MTPSAVKVTFRMLASFTGPPGFWVVFRAQVPTSAALSLGASSTLIGDGVTGVTVAHPTVESKRARAANIRALRAGRIASRSMMTSLLVEGHYGGGEGRFLGVPFFPVRRPCPGRWSAA